MKLRVLVDNNTYIDQYYLGEPGLSYYIEEGELKILFDAGYSDAFLKNTETMGIDLSGLTHVVLSHGHDDHTRGLKYLAEAVEPSAMKDMELIAHPLCFSPKWDEGLFCGSPFSREEAMKLFHENLSSAPVFLTPELCFLGEIPVVHQFEERKGLGTTVDGTGNTVSDLLFDDTALAYRTKDGLAIITGCSHSGICNIITYAQEVMGERRIALIVGGFHLLQADERLEKTTEFLKDLYQEHPFRFYPCHCVSLASKISLASAIPVEEVGVGLELELSGIIKQK